MEAYLVDGTFELFRSFFAVPKSTAPSGQEVGAARGLLRGFAAWLSRGEVTHIACAFDHVIESFRNELFDGYKTGAGIDPDLYAQFELAERVTRALGVRTWPMIEFEADDALATAASELARDPDFTRIVIASPDKDLAQCVENTRVVCWDRLRDKWLDEAGVHTKFGVPPSAIPDYLALVGDAADGIPGIPRWGAKSASALLARYGTLEAIPNDAASWDVRVRGASALGESLSERRELSLLYRKLATLRRDAPIPMRAADIAWRGAPEIQLRAICEELGEAVPSKLALY